MMLALYQGGAAIGCGFRSNGTAHTRCCRNALAPYTTLPGSTAMVR